MLRLFKIIPIVFLGASAFAEVPKTPNQFGGSLGGRFQIVQISEFRRDQYLIDTQTGRLWKSICYEVNGNECRYEYFTEKFVENLPASKGRDLRDWIDKNPAKENATKD